MINDKPGCGTFESPAPEPARLTAVKVIHETHCREIPEMLRKLAERIEKGEVKTEHVACVVDAVPGLQMYAWGPKAEVQRTALCLTRAAEWVLWQAVKIDFEASGKN